MDKKYHNWLGWILILLYIGIFFILIIIGLYMNKIGNIPIRNIFYSATTFWFIIFFIISPVTLNKTLYKLLPINTAYATLISKHEEGRHAYFSNGTTTTTIKCFLTFELNNGERKVFNVKTNDFNSFIEYETGTLTYKEQGKHIYFVKFEPDSPKDGAY